MIKAIIFDMDGVISDTQNVHAIIVSKIFAKHGMDITPEDITTKYAGRRISDILQDFLDDKEQIRRIVQEVHETMRSTAEERVDEIPGTRQLIQTLHKNYPLAVASSSHEQYVSIVLNTLKLTSYFTKIINGSMIENGKPDPDIFLLAAKELDVAPEHCLVIEDARAGMQAAISAGMTCIGYVKEKNDTYPTTHLVTDMGEVMGIIDRLKMS